MQTIRSCLDKAINKIHGDATMGCASCAQETPVRKLLGAPCGHLYCSSCVRRMALVALENLELFPPKCCRREIPSERIVSVMSSRTKKRYIAKSEEQAIPSRDRIYCPRTRCGRWIHPKYKGSRPGTQVCPHCRTKVCVSCCELAHGILPCPDDESTKNVLKMAKKYKWQRCTKCGIVVEKVDGCNHIHCICGNDFCYVCGCLESRCECPTHDTTEEVAEDGDLDVNTLAAARGGGRYWGECSR